MAERRSNSLRQYPVNPRGSLLHYAEKVWDGSRYVDPTMVPNDPFHATLRLSGMESGRSAKYVLWAAVDPLDGRTWPMFVADLIELAQHATITNGVVSGRWQVCKRGQNYGLARAVTS